LGTGDNLVTEVLEFLPEGRTKSRLGEAQNISPDDFERAYRELGTGNEVAAFDTVPFCVWMAAHHGTDFADAMWKTVAGLGDRDTTCAMVGGILAAGKIHPPNNWIATTEPLPDFQ
jgi:ADP-ribosylglycohydrolase